MLKNNKINKNEIEKFALKYAEEFNTSKDTVLNLIEKIVCWYEFRYPVLKLTNIFNERDLYGGNIDNKIFYENPSMEGILNTNTKQEIKWEDFYNFDVFYNLLSVYEQTLISKPRYSSIIFGPGFHIHVTPDGMVDREEVISLQLYYNSIKDEDIREYHISDLILLFDRRGIKLPYNTDIVMAVNNYNKKRDMLEQLFKFAAIKLIEHGICTEGYRRAFLFCKEFNLNMQLLIDKGVLDTNDLNLFKQMNEYCHDMEDLVTDHIMKKYLKLTNI